MSRLAKKLKFTNNNTSTTYETQVESAICDGEGVNIAENYATQSSVKSIATSNSPKVSDLNNRRSLYEYIITLYKSIQGAAYKEFLTTRAYSFNPNLSNSSAQVASSLTAQQKDLIENFTRGNMCTIGRNYTNNWQSNDYPEVGNSSQIYSGVLEFIDIDWASADAWDLTTRNLEPQISMSNIQYYKISIVKVNGNPRTLITL